MTIDEFKIGDKFYDCATNCECLCVDKGTVSILYVTADADPADITEWQNIAYDQLDDCEPTANGEDKSLLMKALDIQRNVEKIAGDVQDLCDEIKRRKGEPT